MDTKKKEMPKNIVITADCSSDEELEQIHETSGQNLGSCYQCGNCSAGCPSADFMELTPHQVMRFLQMGLVEELLEANTQWVCAACNTCVVRCPRSVDVARIMEALRQLQLRKNENHVNLNELDSKKLKDLPQIALIGNFRKTTL